MMETGALQSSNEKLKEYCSELRKKVNLNGKILFINSPQFNFHTFEKEVAKNRCYYAYPPTGLQYLTSALEDRNLKVKILDLNYELLKRVNLEDFDYRNWLEILKEILEEFKPSIIGISNPFNVDSYYFKEISKFLREREKAGEKYIILAGGQNATYNAKKFLEQGLCDFVCKRESENKIRFLFSRLYDDGKECKPVPGIVFKFNGKVEETEGDDKKDVVELKESIINTYNLLPIENYCKVGALSPYSRMVGKDTPFAGVLLNRGCGGNCKFCDVVDYMGKGVRSRNIKDVLDEIIYLYEKRGIRYFEILDDDFTRYKDKVLELLSKISEKGLKIKWASNNGFIAISLNEEIMSKMRDSGCMGFKIGVESGNPEILKTMRKPGTIKTFMQFSEMAQNFPEMFIVDNYIIGLPDETFGQMLDSFHFSLGMNLDWSSFAVYQQNTSFFGEGKERENEDTGDFIPSKNHIKGKLISPTAILLGPKIFDIPQDKIPSKEQLNEIWFSFNLIRNFIQNKNLTSKGGPEKFISWLEVIEERYPTHPYMNFFLALAYLLINKKNEAEIQYRKAIKNLEDEYWKERFKQFEMDKIMDNFPDNADKAREALEFLRRKHAK